jgi:hypothetical protein
MHQVLFAKPDLVILDDPVSSFDKTKKFAILNELFRGKSSLRDTTALLLTHDIEPAIDVVKSVKRLFQQPKPTAFFLTSRSGIVSEKEIQEGDIQTFAQVCFSNIKNLSDELIKSIYLRRHFEILNDLGAEYNYLSNLLHARQAPTQKNGDPMTPEDIASAVDGIQQFIPSFKYAELLSLINDKEEMKSRFEKASVGYDKLQLFRIYKQVHIPADVDDDAALQKFVNESFHIENEYLMQLNPHSFDAIPEYVLAECDRIVSVS